MHAPRRPLAAVVLALAVGGSLLAAGAAHARGHLQTRQTGVNILAGQRAGRLVLANTGDAPVAAQVRVYAWSQDGGSEDLLQLDDGLIASPPIVEIPAGGEQLVRLVRPTAAPPAQELSYRVVVDALPGSPKDGAGTTIALRMRYVLPAFVRAADAAPADVQCRIDAGALACENRGGHAAQLAAPTLVDAAGRKTTITPGLLGYVLAGSARRWPLDAGALSASTPTTLEVRLNSQPVTLVLGSRH